MLDSYHRYTEAGIDMEEFRHKEFGAKVRRWRQALQPPLTQRELAQALSVSDGFLAHIETGRTLPSVKTLALLSKELGVPFMEMLEAAGQLPPDPELGRDGALLEPELRLFFRDDWRALSQDEQDLLRDFVRMLKTRLRRRQSHTS
jgi:transcriptional regulator with XRE-family HTH domain